MLINFTLPIWFECPSIESVKELIINEGKMMIFLRQSKEKKKL